MSNPKYDHKVNLILASEFLATMKRRGVERKAVFDLLDEADLNSKPMEFWWQVVVDAAQVRKIVYEDANEQKARNAMDILIDLEEIDCALLCNGRVVASCENGKMIHHDLVEKASELDAVYANKKSDGT